MGTIGKAGSQLHVARHHHPSRAPDAKPASAPKAAGWQAKSKAAPALGSGRPAIDFNGTKYTKLEGRAADNHISIESKRKFDPLTEPGIALTTSQAKSLGVKVGDTVKVRDTVTGKTVTATYYDNAGTKPDGLKHFEVSPALADSLGIDYRNKKGNVVDAVTNGSAVNGRFVIEK